MGRRTRKARATSGPKARGDERRVARARLPRDCWGVRDKPRPRPVDPDLRRPRPASRYFQPSSLMFSPGLRASEPRAGRCVRALRPESGVYSPSAAAGQVPSRRSSDPSFPRPEEYGPVQRVLTAEGPGDPGPDALLPRARREVGGPGAGIGREAGCEWTDRRSRQGPVRQSKGRGHAARGYGSSPGGGGFGRGGSGR